VAGPTYSTPRDKAVVAPSLLANATDADGDNLTVVGHSQPAYGHLTVAPDGSFVYVPFDFAGPSSRADSFAFNVSDGQGGITQGVVSLTIGERPAERPGQGGREGREAEAWRRSSQPLAQQRHFEALFGDLGVRTPAAAPPLACLHDKACSQPHMGPKTFVQTCHPQAPAPRHGNTLLSAGMPDMPDAFLCSSHHPPLCNLSPCSAPCSPG
jgi:hypothetical protein